MIQAIAKLSFVERYCSPADGWQVFVDIDPSEEGHTGSPRSSQEARDRQQRMQVLAPRAVRGLAALGAHVGQRKRSWIAVFGQGLQLPGGDRDVIAVHRKTRRLLIAEVEGDSGGQPEGKVYKALGQLVMAAGEPSIDGYKREMVLVVWGREAARHLARAKASVIIGISGLVIAEQQARDRWLFRARRWTPQGREAETDGH